MTSPYDMSDYHALIRGIREIDRSGQDSTLARLVCADWLEERGEAERAAFARVQVRYTAIHKDDTPERDELSGLLQTRFAIRIATPTPFAPDCPNRMWPEEIHKGVPREWDWLAGWLSAVRCPLAWWITHGPDLCRRHPVREVVVTDTPTVDVVNRIQATLFNTTDYDGTPNFSLFRAMLSAVTGVRNEPASFVAALCPVLLRWAEHEADRPRHG